MNWHTSQSIYPWSQQIIVDDMDLRGHDADAEDKIEKEADDMASRGLIPKNVWDQKPIDGKATVAKVNALAEKLKIHPQ